MQRGLDTVAKKYRRKIFVEVAKFGFKGNEETLKDDMEEIPYMMINEDTVHYRDSVYRARAVARERIRLAMGLSLRPENRPTPLAQGVEASK